MLHLAPRRARVDHQAAVLDGHECSARGPCRSCGSPRPRRPSRCRCRRAARSRRRGPSARRPSLETDGGRPRLPVRAHRARPSAPAPSAGRSGTCRRKSIGSMFAAAASSSMKDSMREARSGTGPGERIHAVTRPTPLFASAPIACCGVGSLHVAGIVVDQRPRPADPSDTSRVARPASTAGIIVDVELRRDVGVVPVSRARCRRRRARRSAPTPWPGPSGPSRARRARIHWTRTGLPIAWESSAASTDAGSAPLRP